MNKKEIKNFVKFFNTTTKVFIWLLTIAGLIWITWAFILATRGQEQIAETLATEVCRTLLGGVSVYVITSGITNVFKYNDGIVFGTSREIKDETEDNK